MGDEETTTEVEVEVTEEREGKRYDGGEIPRERTPEESEASEE